MKVVQIIKKLNNTELGKGGTHDTYVLIPNNLNVSDIFDEPDKPVEFIDQETLETITVRNTVRREKRIVGLGQYYRSKDLSAGDEIIFEKREFEEKTEFFVSVKKNINSLVFQKSRYGFDILTPERIKNFESISIALDKKVEVNFLKAAKKRNDSPDTTNYYDILISGKSILPSYSGKELGEIQISGNKVQVFEFYGWKKYVFETEETN